MRNAVIVADDSEIIQRIVEENLKGKFVVLKAKNGNEVVAHIINNNYNIIGIFLDLNMPESDGFMVLDYFKANNLFKRLPIIIISGDDTKETIERAFTYPIIDMLNKPFSRENIYDAVNKMISLKK